MSEISPYTEGRIAASLERMPAILDRFAGLRRARAVDVGCGAGFDTLALAGQFDHVIGLDIDAAALAEAARAATAHGIANVVFRRGDAATELAGSSYDFAWCNLMSHNTRSRVELLDAIRGALRDGGGLFYSEECEGYVPMAIDTAIEERNVAELVQRLRQVNAVINDSEGMRFFVHGTAEPVLVALGFDRISPKTSEWNGLVYQETVQCRVSAPATRVDGPDRDYLGARPDLAAGFERYREMARMVGLGDTPRLHERIPILRNRLPQRVDWPALAACHQRALGELGAAS